MNEHLQDLIISSYDPEDLVKILEITAEEILERFKDKVEQNLYKFNGDE